MYEVLKLEHGTATRVDVFADFDRARTEAVGYSRREAAPFLVVRVDFGDPLVYCWRGRKLTPPEMVLALTLDNPPPVVTYQPSVRPAPEEVALPAPPEPRRRRKAGPTETKARKGPSDYKQSPGFVTDIDTATGVVKAIVSVFGVVDDGDDIIHPGAFVKTLSERGHRVRVLNSHNSRDVLSVVGRPVTMREIGRGELPPAVLLRYPEATGGLLTETQYLLDDPTSKAVYDRIAAGLIDEYSIGFDIVDKPDYSKLDQADGTKRTVRNIRAVRLWEYSPVIWGMNPASATVDVKTAPEEVKPYGAVEQDDQWCVFKLDADGQPTGATLGCHDSQEDAEEQIAALYASEDKQYTPDGPQPQLGDALLGHLNQTAQTLIAGWLKDGMVDDAESALLTALCATHTQAIRTEMSQDVALRPLPTFTFESLFWNHPGGTATKIGRVLSAANFEKIEQAAALLSAVLEAATPATDELPDKGIRGPAPAASIPFPGSPDHAAPPTSPDEAGPDGARDTLQAAMLQFELDLAIMEGLRE